MYSYSSYSYIYINPFITKTIVKRECFLFHTIDIDYDIVSAREREVRHDVMAHIYAYGKAAPDAAGIIHLGATSCYVTDNADLILYRDGLVYLRKELCEAIAALCDFADKYKALPTVGYTHY